MSYSVALRITLAYVLLKTEKDFIHRKGLNKRTKKNFRALKRTFICCFHAIKMFVIELQQNKKHGTDKD